MPLNEQAILERLRAETGYSVSHLGEIPAISGEIPVTVYRVLIDSVPEVEDPGLRWMILTKFHGEGAGTFLPDLLALLSVENDTMNESSIYQSIGFAVKSRSAISIWELIENNKVTEGYLIFANRILKIQSVRDRVVSRLLQITQSGRLSENLLLGLANCPVDSVAEEARRMLGSHPELQHTKRRKPSSGRAWKEVFGPADAAVGSREIQSFNCDLTSVMEDLRAECPPAFELIERSQVTLDQIASIPTGRTGTVSGEPGVAFHRIDESELHVFVYDRIPRR